MSRLFGWLVDLYTEAGAVDEAAETAYEAAIDMCGNDGQVSVIEMTGDGAFYDAAEEAAGEGDPYAVLMAACPYPEAVGEILAEAAAIIEDIIGDAGDWLFDDSGDDDFDEGSGEGEFDF